MKRKLLDYLFFPPKETNDFDLSRYIQDLNSQKFRDVFNLGVSEDKGGSWLLKNFSKEPNAIFVGAMGSGKSVAANFSVLTWMLANSDQTILFLADTLKGANDYQALFDYPQVYKVFNSEVGIHRVIDLIYDETMARKEAFNEINAESIEEYEKKMKKITGDPNYRLSRIILMMEEFHAIPYNILNFDKDFKTPNTSAFKFHQITRIGRTYGSWLVACSQKGTKSDVPPEVIPNFTQKQIFKVNRNEASYFLSDTRASELRSDQKGRCFTDFGEVQFPFININSQRKLLEKYMKPMTANSAYLTDKLIRDYLGGRSTEELYKLKKLPDLIEGIESYDHNVVVAMMHKRLNHGVTPVDSTIDPFGISLIVEWPNKGKIAVMVRVHSKKITAKHLNNLYKGMQTMGCDRGILYTSAEDLPATVYKAAVEKRIELVDFEDMLKLARQIEAKTKALEDLDPSRLADSSKESGDYQSLNNIMDSKEDFSLVESESEDEDDENEEVDDMVDESSPASSYVPEKKSFIKEIKEQDEEEQLALKALESLLGDPTPAQKKEDKSTALPDDLSQMVESTLITEIEAQQKTIKRAAVRGQFSLRPDDSPELLIKTHKTPNGEVFRVMFNVVVNKKSHHKFFLDRQVQGDFSLEQKNMLGIMNTREWNTQKDEANNRFVLLSQDFEKEMLEFLENFKQYELGMVKIICWRDSVAFLKPILDKSRYVDSNPSTFEDNAHMIGLDTDRKKLLADFNIVVKKEDIFQSIEEDLLLWKAISP